MHKFDASVFAEKLEGDASVSSGRGKTPAEAGDAWGGRR